MALARFSSAAFLTDAQLAVAAGATIEVRRESDSGLATLFSDRAGTVGITNPSAFADSKGRFTFCVVGIAGGYSIEVTSGAESFTLNNVAIGLAAELDASAYGGSLMNAANAAAARATLGSTATGDAVFIAASAAAARAVLEVYSKTEVGQVSSVVAVGRNITARTNAATPASQIDIDADELQLKDASGNAYVASAVNLTVAITAAGANGLDTGAEAASTWYYGWVIYNPTTSTVAGLLSASATAPTMPSGYTYKALVTAVRNDGSSNFLAYRQYGNEVFYENRQLALNAGAAGTETAVSTASFVPPVAHSAHVSLRIIQTPGASAVNWQADVRVISGLEYFDLSGGTAASAAASVYNDAFITMPNISQNFYYLVTIIAGSSGSASLGAWVNGFKLPGSGE